MDQLNRDFLLQKDQILILKADIENYKKELQDKEKEKEKFLMEFKERDLLIYELRTTID